MGYGGRGSKSQLSSVVSAQRGDFVSGQHEESICPLRIFKKNFASLGQLDARSGPVEELDADVFLQRLDLAG